jgi:hypothetical protein
MSIARMRRELMRMPKRKLLFLDETYVRMSIHPTHTIVAPGYTQYVVAHDTDAYAARYDMIACVSAERVFPPMIFTPRIEWTGRLKEYVSVCCMPTSRTLWLKPLKRSTNLDSF